MLSRRERKARHLAAAEHLRRAFANDGEEVAEAISAHLLDAYRAAQDDPDSEQLRVEALAALRRAGQRAATVGAPDAGERAYLTAIELADDEQRPELQELAGEMALRAARPGPGLEFFDRAVAAHEAAGREREAARLARSIGVALRSLGRLEEASERMRHALDVLERYSPDSDAVVASVTGELGTSFTFAGRYDEAQALLERSMSLAEALELHDVVAQGMVRKSALYTNIGRFAEAQALIEGAVVVGERYGLTFESCRAQSNRGDLMLKRDLPGAVEASESALVTSRRIGDRRNEITCAANLMLALIYAGRWEDARTLGAQISAYDEDDSVVQAEPIHHMRLGVLGALQGDLDLARRSADIVNPLRQSEDTELRGMAAGAVGRVALAEGHPEQTLEAVSGVIREAVAVGDTSGETIRQCWPDAVDAALGIGDAAAVDELVALLGPQRPGLLPPLMRAELARARGLVSALRGEAEAEVFLRAALDAVVALGYPYWLARSRADLAGWLMVHDRAAEATELLDDAIAAFRQLGAAPALAAAEALRAETPAAVSVA
jgi:tetratricopeptide (TPR) repeat protein